MISFGGTRLVLVHFAGLGERLRHGRSGPPALARIGFVDDDGEGTSALSLPISSRMKGNFCTVEMMIFLRDARFRSGSVRSISLRALKVELAPV